MEITSMQITKSAIIIHFRAQRAFAFNIQQILLFTEKGNITTYVPVTRFTHKSNSFKAFKKAVSFIEQAPVVQKIDSAIHRISIRETNCAIQWIQLFTQWTALSAFRTTGASPTNTSLMGNHFFFLRIYQIIKQAIRHTTQR